MLRRALPAERVSVFRPRSPVPPPRPSRSPIVRSRSTERTANGGDEVARKSMPCRVPTGMPRSSTTMSGRHDRNAWKACSARSMTSTRKPASRSKSQHASRTVRRPRRAGCASRSCLRSPVEEIGLFAKLRACELPMKRESGVRRVTACTKRPGRRGHTTSRQSGVQPPSARRRRRLPLCVAPRMDVWSRSRDTPQRIQVSRALVES